MPDEAPVEESHAGALLWTVQAQFVVTAIEPVAAFLSTDALCGEMLIEHVCAACEKLMILLLTITEPVRALAVLLGATVKETLPSPLPAAAVWKVIQGTVEEALQVQPVVVATSKEPSNPSIGAVIDVAERVTSHEAPAWETANTALPIVMLPVRCWGSGFCSARQVTAAFPDPAVAEVTVSQEAFDVACQVQLEIKLNAAEAPNALTAAEVGDTW